MAGKNQTRGPAKECPRCSDWVKDCRCSRLSVQTFARDMQLHRLIVEERHDRWLIHREGKMTETYWTAADALRAIKENATVLAELGLSSAIRIEWRTTSRVGRMVVNAITKDGQS